MYRRLALLTGGLILLGTVVLYAQEPILEQTYGTGVHAYFSQDHVKAHELLTTAIDGGSKDPRCYYFRGLCCLQLGREEEAKPDFEKAAELETLDVSKFFNVAKSLERIQGSSRLLMEEYRAKARMIALKREQELRANRYEEIRSQEQRILRQQADRAPDKPIDLSKQPAPANGNPFGLSPIKEPAPVKSTVEPAAAPAAAAPAKAGDPFAAPAKPAAAKPAAPAPAVPAKTGDPFAAPAKPAMDTPAAAAPAVPAKTDDPFAAPAKPAAAKPAAVTPAPAKPVAPAKPAAATPAAPAKPAAATPAAPAPAKTEPADDPFAAPAKPAAATPAAATPAAATPAAATPAAPAPAKTDPADDPFADPAPAKK